MSWLDTISDQWGGRSGTVRLVVRFVGLSVFVYLLIVQGAFSGPLWVAIGTGLALALAYVIMVLRTRKTFGWLAFALVVAMMICGAVINPQVSFTGSVFFVVGGIVLIGQPELSLRVSVPVVVAVSALLVLVAVIQHPTVLVFFSTMFGALAVGLFGAVRRQRTLREQQDKALAARSQELEERNADLLAQTEKTRQEASRVAALQERGRIARDLHDLLAHSLGGLVVQLDAAGAELESGHTERAVERLRASRQLAVDGLREARAAVQELRSEDDPAGAVPVDLVDALAPVLRGPVGLHLGADLEVVGTPRPVRPSIADALVATCREGLTNVNKHADRRDAETSVSLTLIYGPDDISLEVVSALADVPASLAEPPHELSTESPTEQPTDPPTELSASGAGAGLPGLRERLQLVGGVLSAGPEGRRWVLTACCPVRDLDLGVGQSVESAQEVR